MVGKASHRGVKRFSFNPFLQRRKLRPSERRQVPSSSASGGVVRVCQSTAGPPSVMLMDAIEPFDPKGGLHEWVRGPWTEPARLLVASWGRGPVAGMEPAGMFQSLLGGRSQGKRALCFSRGETKARMARPEDLASCLEHTDTLAGYLTSSWFCSKPWYTLLRNGLVMAALPLAFSVEQEKVLQQ